MAYTAIDDAGIFFNTKLYTGTGASNAQTGVGFQPDFTWIKNRDAADFHVLTDAVRGVTNYIMSDSTAAEVTNAESLTSFDSDGFTVGTMDEVNTSTEAFVAWNWKADGSGSSNSEGDITATVSAETTAGFSIIKFTGNGSHSQSIGHGLNGTPTFWGVKNLTDDGVDFTCYLKGTDRIKLTTAEAMEQNYLMSASSTLLTTPSNASWVGGVSGKDYIMYAWQQLQGYSKFGTYVGNGNANAPFVYTGFRPAMVIVKNFSTGSRDWVITDNKRGAFNPAGERLYPNLSDGEDTSGDYFNYLSNGFKFDENVNLWNTSGESYFYMAFAESPFVNSKGVPTNAR